MVLQVPGGEGDLRTVLSYQGVEAPQQGEMCEVDADQAWFNVYVSLLEKGGRDYGMVTAGTQATVLEYTAEPEEDLNGGDHPLDVRRLLGPGLKTDGGPGTSLTRIKLASCTRSCRQSTTTL